MLQNILEGLAYLGVWVGRFLWGSRQFSRAFKEIKISTRP